MQGEIVEIQPQVVQRAVGDAAGRQVEPRMAAGLGEMHVVGFLDTVGNGHWGVTGSVAVGSRGVWLRQ